MVKQTVGMKINNKEEALYSSKGRRGTRRQNLKQAKNRDLGITKGQLERSQQEGELDRNKGSPVKENIGDKAADVIIVEKRGHFAGDCQRKKKEGNVATSNTRNDSEEE